MSWKKILSVQILFLFLYSSLNASKPHPFYLSVTEIEYFPKDHRIGISIKMFSDDLENALNVNRNSKMDITNGNKTQNKTLLKTYLQQHFSIVIDGQQKIPVFLGYEIDRDAIWVYFELNAQQKSPSFIDVNTDILYDQHEEQINIIHSIVNGSRTSKKLTFPEHKCSFKY